MRLDGRAVVRLSSSGDRPASARAREVEQRLRTLLDHDSPLPAARAESTRGGTALTITVSGVPVVSVTPEDARDALSSTEELATRWASTFDAALAAAQDRRRGVLGRVGAEVAASVRAAFGRVGESAVTIVPRAVAAALVLALFWVLAAGVRRLLRAVFHRFVDDLTTENLFKQVAYYAVWALGALIAVDALGLDTRSIAAGLGLTGLALGFALKDILSNFVSGMLLLALRPFRVGDQIVVGETEGTVERIVLRATQVRTYDGRLVLIPNAEVFTSRVTNNTAAPIRRGSVEVFLGYGVDLNRAFEVFAAGVRDTAGVLSDPEPSIQVRRLAEDDVVLEVRFWTDSRRSDYTETSSRVREALLASAKGAGIPLPDPDARTVTLQGRERASGARDATTRT